MTAAAVDAVWPRGGVMDKWTLRIQGREDEPDADGPFPTVIYPVMEPVDPGSINPRDVATTTDARDYYRCVEIDWHNRVAYYMFDRRERTTHPLVPLDPSR